MIVQGPINIWCGFCRLISRLFGQVIVHAEKQFQFVTVKETLTVLINEYMPLNCMLIKGYAFQLLAVGEPHKRPERVLDLRSLSRGRFDELDECCRLGTNQKEIGLIGPVSHHPSCNCPRLLLEARWMPPHQLNDGERDSEIPLRTGCDTAALNMFKQMATGARMDSCVPDSLFEQRAKCGKSRIGG
jgi:hypothetical protein